MAELSYQKFLDMKRDMSDDEVRIVLYIVKGLPSSHVSLLCLFSCQFRVCQLPYCFNVPCERSSLSVVTIGQKDNLLPGPVFKFFQKLSVNGVVRI